MSQAFVCERCGVAFESAEARCPKCLRKSSVRGASDPATASDAARLAAGDRSQTSAARRATALTISIVACALLAAALMLAWGSLVALNVIEPALAAWLVAAIVWTHAALADGRQDERPWSTFALRVGLGLGLAAWAFTAGILAIASTAGLSSAFTVVIAVVLFIGPVVPVLRWMQRREDPPSAPTGKWR